uniref:Oxysterol-binding protein-related protein 9-like isoform X2 n=1 Tax=Castor canadensis TaxID=51338 RepID=A0A8B7U8X5_CASCN|nr:oxysterol-binding protein-related protein 9-like isoform X2 [Castor canadensis]
MLVADLQAAREKKSCFSQANQSTWRKDQGAVIGIDDEDDSTFTITVDQKTFHFQARDADEREKWIHALEETILRHTLQLQVRVFTWFLYSSLILGVICFSFASFLFF